MAETPPSTLRTHVAQRLRKDILAGKYKPGDRLNESSIAREFKISRIPVREALFELRESGLVMNRERRGMFVTSLSEDEIQKINSLRVILEVEALTLAKAKMTQKVAAMLQGLVEKMESSTCSVSDAAAMDLEFHRAVWAATGNEYLQKVLDPLATLLFAHTLLERVNVTHRNWLLNHHRALLDVILGPKDIDVRSALLTHLQAAYPTTGREESVSLEAEAAPPKTPARTTKRKAAKKTV